MFFEYAFKNGITDKHNTAQAIWQVGKGDLVCLELLNMKVGCLYFVMKTLVKKLQTRNFSSNRTVNCKEKTVFNVNWSLRSETPADKAVQRETPQARFAPRNLQDRKLKASTWSRNNRTSLAELKRKECLQQLVKNETLISN